MRGMSLEKEQSSLWQADIPGFKSLPTELREALTHYRNAFQKQLEQEGSYGHGSPLVLDRITERFLTANALDLYRFGAHLAQNGAFTQVEAIKKQVITAHQPIDWANLSNSGH